MVTTAVVIPDLVNTADTDFRAIVGGEFEAAALKESVTGPDVAATAANRTNRQCAAASRTDRGFDRGVKAMRKCSAGDIDPVRDLMGL